MQAGGGVVEKICAVDGEIRGGGGKQAVAVGIAGEILNRAASAALDFQAGVVGVIEADQILDEREIAAVIKQHAVLRVVVGGDAFDDCAGGAAGGVDAVAAAGEGEEADLHEVGVIKIN